MSSSGVSSKHPQVPVSVTGSTPKQTPARGILKRRPGDNQMQEHRLCVIGERNLEPVSLTVYPSDLVRRLELFRQKTVRNGERFVKEMERLDREEQSFNEWIQGLKA